MDNDNNDHFQSIHQLIDEIVALPELIIHPPTNETITVLVGNIIDNDIHIKKLFAKFLDDYDVTLPEKKDNEYNSATLKQYGEYMNIFALKYCKSFEPIIPSNINLIKHCCVVIKKEGVIDIIKSFIIDYIVSMSKNHTTMATQPSNTINNLNISDYLKIVIKRITNDDNWLEFCNTMFDLFMYYNQQKIHIWNIRDIKLKNKCMTYYLKYGKSISDAEIISIDKDLHKNFINIQSWTINTIGNLAYAYIHSNNKEIRTCAKKCIDFWRNVNEETLDLLYAITDS